MPTITKYFTHPQTTIRERTIFAIMEWYSQSLCDLWLEGKVEEDCIDDMETIRLAKLEAMDGSELEYEYNERIGETYINGVCVV